MKMLTKVLLKNTLICSFAHLLIWAQAGACLPSFCTAKTRTWGDSLSSATCHAEFISASINYTNNKAFCRAF